MAKEAAPAAAAMGKARAPIDPSKAAAAAAAKERGFFAADIGALLKRREEMADEAHFLRSDELSSGSSDWDGGGAASSDEEENKQAAGSKNPNGEIAVDSVSFEDLKKRFANQPFADPEPGLDPYDDVGPLVNIPSISLPGGAGGGARGSFAPRGSITSQNTKNTVITQRTEPVARRLARVRGEVDALCAWAASRQEAKTADAKGQSALAQEAEKLREELRGVAGLVQQAARAPEVRSSEASSKQVWLPPQEEDRFELVKNLVDMNRLSEHVGHDGQGRHANQHSGDLKYSLAASMGQKGGWLAAAEGEVLADLERRIRIIGQALGGSGAGSSAEGEGGLAGATVRLHRRLDALHQVHDEPAVQRLQAAVRLLSAEIDTIVAEGHHLEAVEADVSQDLVGGEETVAQQVARLHNQVVGFDAVARRVEDLQKTLASQEESHRELFYFCRDLANAERQGRHACGLLASAGEAAEAMKQAAEANKKQLLANMSKLEKSLKHWQAKHPAPARDVP